MSINRTLTPDPEKQLHARCCFLVRLLNEPVIAALFAAALSLGGLGCVSAPAVDSTSAALQFRPMDDARSLQATCRSTPTHPLSSEEAGGGRPSPAQRAARTPDGGGPVRFAHMVADFNVNHLWIQKSNYYGPIDMRSSDPH
jgi:hypothetical protein